MPAQKYEAIYNDLKEKIEEGIYAPQSILPSENNLTARYGVSRNTIRRAMAVVTSETYNAAGEMFEYTQSRHRPDM